MIKELKPRMKVENKDTGKSYFIEKINRDLTYGNSCIISLIDTDTGKEIGFPEYYVKDNFEEIKENMKEKTSKFKVGDYAYYNSKSRKKYGVCKINKIKNDRVFGVYMYFDELPKNGECLNDVKEKYETEGFMFKEELIKLEFKEELLHKGDKIKITNGIFEGIEGIIDTILANTNKFYIYVGDKNKSLITVDAEDIELLVVAKPEIIKPKNENFCMLKFYNGSSYNCGVKIRGFRTTVILLDSKVKGSVYANSDDKYDREDGITRALSNKLLKEIRE